MRMRAKLKEADFDFVAQSPYITLVIDSVNLEELNGLKNRNLVVDIKELEKAKTPSQNRYFWELATKIALATRTTKESVYQQLLKDYGQPIAELKTDKINDMSGFDIHYILTKRGRKFNHYLVVKGISLMTTKEMTDFIEVTISEAQELGIETSPPFEWERLKSLWASQSSRTT